MTSTFKPKNDSTGNSPSQYIDIWHNGILVGRKWNGKGDKPTYIYIKYESLEDGETITHVRNDPSEPWTRLDTDSQSIQSVSKPPPRIDSIKSQSNSSVPPSSSTLSSELPPPRTDSQSILSLPKQKPIPPPRTDSISSKLPPPPTQYELDRLISQQNDESDEFASISRAQSRNIHSSNNSVATSTYNTERRQSMQVPNHSWINYFVRYCLSCCGYNRRRPPGHIVRQFVGHRKWNDTDFHKLANLIYSNIYIDHANIAYELGSSIVRNVLNEIIYLIRNKGRRFSDKWSVDNPSKYHTFTITRYIEAVAQQIFDRLDNPTIDEDGNVFAFVTKNKTYVQITPDNLKIASYDLASLIAYALSSIFKNIRIVKHPNDTDPNPELVLTNGKLTFHSKNAFYSDNIPDNVHFIQTPKGYTDDGTVIVNVPPIVLHNKKLVSIQVTGYQTKDAKIMEKLKRNIESNIQNHVNSSPVDTTIIRPSTDPEDVLNNKFLPPRIFNVNFAYTNDKYRDSPELEYIKKEYDDILNYVKGIAKINKTSQHGIELKIYPTEEMIELLAFYRLTTD